MAQGGSASICFNPFSLDGRNAVVTGGGRGIGRACAQVLARAGARVAVVSRTATQLEETVELIRAAGVGEAYACPCDLGDTAQIEGLLANLNELWPGEGPHVLVNNAAISPYVKGAEQMTDEEWSHILRVNLDSAFNLSRALGSLMLDRGRGAIVNVTSVAADRALARLAAYSASKAALGSLTRTMAAEWAQRGVRVNAVAPAYIATEMTSELQKRDKLRTWVEDRTPMGRFGEPEEVAHAILFLASNAASYITGTTLYVDGGWTAV